MFCARVLAAMRKHGRLSDFGPSQHPLGVTTALVVRDKRRSPPVSPTANVSGAEEAGRPQSPAYKRQRALASAGGTSASRETGAGQAALCDHAASDRSQVSAGGTSTQRRAWRGMVPATCTAVTTQPKTAKTATPVSNHVREDRTRGVGVMAVAAAAPR